MDRSSAIGPPLIDKGGSADTRHEEEAAGVGVVGDTPLVDRGVSVAPGETPPVCRGVFLAPAEVLAAAGVGSSAIGYTALLRNLFAFRNVS